MNLNERCFSYFFNKNTFRPLKISLPDGIYHIRILSTGSYLAPDIDLFPRPRETAGERYYMGICTKKDMIASNLGEFEVANRNDQVLLRHCYFDKYVAIEGKGKLLTLFSGEVGCKDKFKLTASSANGAYILQSFQEFVRLSTKNEFSYLYSNENDLLKATALFFEPKYFSKYI